MTGMATRLDFGCGSWPGFARTMSTADDVQGAVPGHELHLISRRPVALDVPGDQMSRHFGGGKTVR